MVWSKNYLLYKYGLYKIDYKLVFSILQHIVYCNWELYIMCCVTNRKCICVSGFIIFSRLIETRISQNLHLLKIFCNDCNGFVSNNNHKLITIASSSFNIKTFENPCFSSFKCLTCLMFLYIYDFKDIFFIYHQCFYDSSLGFYLMVVMHIFMVIFIV